MTMPLYGVVMRVRVNSEESGRPAVEAEYVKNPVQRELTLSAIPSREWTILRDEALFLPYDEAQQLAESIGFPAHAVLVKTPQTAPAHRPVRLPRSGYIDPADAYEREERRGLA